jgi:hypothetical protein
MSFITKEQRDALIANGMDEELVDSMFKVRAPRATVKPMPTKRADADGGLCPFFGVPQHWMRDGIDSSNDDIKAGRCGFRRDGHFATKDGYHAHQLRVRAGTKPLPAKKTKAS